MRHLLIGCCLPLITLGCTSNDAKTETSQGAAQPASTKDQDGFIGSYERTDGIEYLAFDLARDGRFTCRLACCLGESGTASGTWSREGNRINLAYTELTGELADRHIGHLLIVDCDGKDRLILGEYAVLLKHPELLKFFVFECVHQE